MADAAELPPVTQQLRFLASGPPMMGWVFNIFLAGVCASTAARQLFNNEYHTRGTKQCVAVVMILYTCNTIITWYEIFYWSTLQNPDYNDLYTFIIPDAIVTIPGGLLAAVVQSLFVFRAYKIIGENKVFLGFMCFLIFGALTGALSVASVALTCALDPTRFTFQQIFYTTQVWLSISAFVDVSITLVLTISLWKYRAGFGKASNDTYTWFMNLTFRTALLTSVFAVAACVTCAFTWAGNSGSVYWVLVYPLPGLYCYSYLWSLESSARKKSVRISMTPNATPPGQAVLAPVDVFMLPELAKDAEASDKDLARSMTSQIVSFPGCARLPDGMV